MTLINPSGMLSQKKYITENSSWDGNPINGIPILERKTPQISKFAMDWHSYSMSNQTRVSAERLHM